MAKKIGIRPWVDFAFRKIFGKPGNEMCIISLLNSILQLPHPIQSVQFTNPFSLKDFQDDKLVCVDVKATDRVGRVFVVEIQVVVHVSFAKRALFYACTAFTDQLRKGQGYGKLKATYCVCLLMKQLWQDKQLHHHYRFVERTTGNVLEESIEIHTIELSKYNGTSESVRNANATELEQWCYWIKNAEERTEEELRELLPALAFLHATAELREICEITEEKEMYDSREKALLDYESNLIDAREEGHEKELEQGLEEGHEKGREEGIEIGRIQLLQELLGGPAISMDELNAMSLEELASTTKSLQSKLRERNAQ